MKNIISILIIFLIALKYTFAYTPIEKDEKILNNIYIKIDKINIVSLQKFYIQIWKLETKYSNNYRVEYLLSELWKYITLKIEWNKLYDVLEVSDWDTVKIDYDWVKTTIRLIWIDTPESFITRFWYKECYWDEASNYLKNLLNWKKISIEFDETQEKKDKYGRLLVYIFLNWENINAKLIQEWFAFEYTYDKDYKYKEDFVKYEKESKELSKWLWNINTCNGERKKTGIVESSEIINSVINNTSIKSSNVNENTIKYYDPNNLNYLNMWFTCEKIKYCKYMVSCEEATYYYKVCGAKTYDGDKDWIPCESLCWVITK